MRQYTSRAHVVVALTTVLWLANDGSYAYSQQDARRTTVPSLVGTSGQKAKSLLATVGLEPKFKLGKPAPTKGQEFEVYLQKPTANAAVAAGTAVELTIYANWEETALDVGPTATHKVTPGDRRPASVVVNHTLLSDGSVQALDLRHGEGQQQISLRRNWLGESFSGPFGIGWSDSNVARLTQEGSDAVSISTGGVVLTRALREGEVFRTPEGTAIRVAESGATLQAADGGTATFDTAGRLTRTQETSGDSTEYRYDAQGRLAAIDNGPDNSLEYTYDRAGRVSRIVGPEGLRVNYEYDGDGRLLAVTNAWSNRIAYQYANSGVLEAANDAYGNRTSIARRAAEPDVIRTETPAAARLQSNVAAQTTSSEPLAGRSLPPLSEEEYDTAGRLTKFTERGRSVVWERDIHGRVVKEQAPDGTNTWTYDRFGRIASVSRAGGDSQTYSYNNLDLPIRIETSPGEWQAYEYDRHGAVISYKTSAGYWEEYEYDHHGRRARLRFAPNRSEQYEYDELDRIVGIQFSPGASVRYGYDSAGRRISEVWSTGERTEKEYDDAGRLVRTVRNGLTITRSYDAQGRLVSVSDPLHGTKTFDYANEADRELGMEWGPGQWKRRTNAWLQPLAAVFDDGQSRRETRYAYDERGDLTSVRSAGGRYWGYRYDPAGRLLGVELPGGQAIGLNRDPLGRVSRVTRDGTMYRDYLHGPTGRLRMESSPLGIAAAYSHDAAGRIQQVVEPSGPVTYERDVYGQITDIVGLDYHIRQEHHADGSLARRNYDTAGLDLKLPIDESARPAGISLNAMQVSYLYGDDGQVVVVQLPGGNSIGVERDAAGRPIRYDYGTGLVVRMAYDHADRETQTRVIDGEAQQSFAEDYEYDALGNLVRMVPADKPERRMSYDEDNRLRGVFTQHDIVAFEYDSNDNLRSVRSNDGTTDWQLDDGGRPVSLGLRSSYEWDRAGNLTSLKDLSAQADNTFDAAGRLVGRRIGEYEWRFGYLPDGDRLWREGPAGRAWFAYLPEGLVGLKDEAGVAWLVVNDPGTGRLLALCGSDGTTYFVIADRLGSIRRVWSPSGKVVASCDYGLFGNVEFNAGQAPLAMYAGMVREDHGLFYARRRYYDPALFRFISIDPLIGSSQMPASHNAYAYAANNPLRYRDPTGTQPGRPFSYDYYDFDDWSDDEVWAHLHDLYEQRRQQHRQRRLPVNEQHIPGHRSLALADSIQSNRVSGELLEAERELARRGLIPPMEDPPWAQSSGTGEPSGPRQRDIQTVADNSQSGGAASQPRPSGTREPRDIQTVAEGTSRSSQSGSQSGSSASTPQRDIPTHADSANQPRSGSRSVDATPSAGTSTSSSGVSTPDGAAPGRRPATQYAGPRRPDTQALPAPRGPTRPYTSPRAGRWPRQAGPRGPRPFISPRSGPWRPRAGTGDAAGGGVLQRIRPFLRPTIGRGVAYASGAGEVLDVLVLIYAASLDVDSRVDATNQGIADRRRLQDWVRRWKQEVEDAWNRRTNDDRQFDILPNADGSMPSLQDLVWRVDSNIYDGLPPLTGIVADRADGGAAARGDQDQFNRDMNQAAGILRAIQKSRTDLDDKRRALNQQQLDAEQTIRAAEGRPQPSAADFDKLKRDTAELNRLIQQYQNRSPDSGPGIASMADELEAAADEVCANSSRALGGAAAEDVARWARDASTRFDRLDQDYRNALQNSGDGSLGQLKQLADSVRAQAHELEQFMELGELGDGGASLPETRDRLRTAADAIERDQQALDAVSLRFRNLVLPWIRESTAQGLWNEFNGRDGSPTSDSAAANPQPSMSLDELERRLASLEQELAELPDDAQEVIDNAKQAVAAADAIDDSDDEEKTNVSEEDTTRAQVAYARLSTCTVELTAVNSSVNGDAPAPQLDMFRALDPTRHNSRSKPSKPFVPLVARKTQVLLRVPNVVGMSAKTALQKVVDAGFSGLPALGQDASTSADVHQVYEQNPAAGTQLPKGGQVRFVFYNDATVMVTVPDVVGMSRGAASNSIKHAKLKPKASVGKRGGKSDKPFHVYQQLPKPGSLVPEDTTVTLMIFDPPDDPPATTKAKPKPKARMKPKATANYDGTYSVGGTYNRIATRLKWQQIDANTARVTFYADGLEPRLLGKSTTAVLTLKKSGNSYTTTNTGGLRNLLTSKVTLTPSSGGRISYQIQQSNGISVSGTATK